MDTPARSLPWTLILPLFAAVSAALAADTEVNFMVGGSLELRPARAPASITSVSWKHHGNVVAEWIDGREPLTYWGILKDRAFMDITTGVLTINNMTKDMEGVFTVEINDQLQPDGYRAKSLKAVPTPQVVLRTLTCSASSESCVLGCIGGTEGAEPVSIFWERGEGQWQEGQDQLKILNLEEQERPKTYRCRMKNPVSQQDSPALPDPFKSGGDGSSPVGGIVGGVVAFLVLGAAAGLLYYFRDREPVSGCLASVRSLRGEPTAPNTNGGPTHPEARSGEDPMSEEMLTKTS